MSGGMGTTSVLLAVALWHVRGFFLGERWQGLPTPFNCKAGVCL